MRGWCAWVRDAKGRLPAPWAGGPGRHDIKAWGLLCYPGALTTINNKLHYMISSPLYFLHRSLQDTPECLEWPERHKTGENTLRDTQNSQAAAGSRPPSPTLSHGTLSPRPEHTDTHVCGHLPGQVRRCALLQIAHKELSQRALIEQANAAMNANRPKY